MRVAVTGGSGVVGTPLVRLLVDEGHHVMALARSDAAARSLGRIGASPVAGDVVDGGSLDELTAGAELVFHVAGINEICSADPDRMDRVNIEGTRNVLEACLRNGVRRLVHTSSAAALGEAPGEIGDESTDHRGVYLSRYERSKHLSELLVARAEGIEVVVVNPSSVQGPGRATGTARIVVEVLRGRLPFLTDARISLVDIEDTARGHLLAARRGRPGGRYVLSGARLTVRDAVGLLSAVSARPIHVRYLPQWVVGMCAPLLEVAGSVRGRQPILCREMARVLRAGAWYDGSLASNELGLVYTPIEATIARMVEWFGAQSLI